MSIVYHFDMDGCLAQWGDVSIEETFKKGYFRGRPAEPELVQACKQMIANGCDVNILSCAYQNGLAEPEKNKWLDEHLGKTGYTRTFVPYGEQKEKYLRKADVQVLVDDYSKNLHSWAKAGHLAIKFYWARGEKRNGKNGSWHGYSVNDKMDAGQIVRLITSVAKAEEEEVAVG